MTKTELQKSILPKIDKKKLIILEWCTGTGKSFAALEILNIDQPAKVLLLVAEEAHKENWKKEINKFQSIYPFVDFSNINITMECYASLKKYRDTEWDIIILDEGHHVVSDIRSELLNTLEANRFIVLSATLERENLEIIKDNITYNPDLIYHSTVTLKQAIQWQIIPEPDIYLIPLTLNSTLRNQIIEESWGNTHKRITYHISFDEYWTYKKNKRKYPHVLLKIKATELEKYEFLNSQINYYRKLFLRTYQEFVKFKWLSLGSERKRFLGEIKTKYIKQLISKIQDKRYICFCSSIDQANELSKKAIHSKNKQKENQRLIEKFQNKEIDSLYCVGMLTEGQNLKDIEVGIIAQLDGKERPFTQKHGRILRSENPVQFILYYKNTRDEEYLEKILMGLDSNYIQKIENLNSFVLN